jgi:hypothetical protein
LADYDLTTPKGRRRAYLDYVFKDHAFLRLRFSNAHAVSEELYRANQPWPFQLEDWKARGIRTVVNLRGGFDASFYALEKDACARLGLNLVDFTITSREVPSRARVHGAKALFESLKYLHVKAGKTGVLDYTFERYLAEGEPAGQTFLEWVDSPAYDPDAIKADFRSNMWGRALTETLLRRE